MKKIITILQQLWTSMPYAKLFRYILVGGCTTGVSFGTYWFLYDIVKMNPTVANAISVIFAVIFAYITNKLFVFRSTCNTLGELMIEIFGFFSSRGATMFLEVGGVFFLYTYMNFTPMISKVIISLFVLILNYLLSYFFIFKSKK